MSVDDAVATLRVMPGPPSLEDVVDAAERAGLRPRKQGAGFRLRCPHPDHVDEDPSASLAEKDGQVLLTCHSQCGSAELTPEERGRWFRECLAALDLSRSEPTTYKHPRRRAAPGKRSFPVYDAIDGHLVGRHHRVDYPAPRGKDMPWDPGIDPNTLALYGANEIPADTHTLVLVEGERAQLALARVLGAGAAAVATFGTGHTPSDAALEVFRGVRAVLFPDNDAKGRSRTVAIGERLRGIAAAVDITPPYGPEYEPGWDAADADDEWVAINLLASATPLGPAEPDELERLVSRMLDLRVVASEARPDPEFGQDALVVGAVPRGQIAVLASTEGGGKSMLRTELTIRVATGVGPFVDCFPVPRAAKVLVFDEEQGHNEETAREEVVLTGLGLDRAALGDRLVRYSFGGVQLDDPAGWTVFEALVEREAAELVVLDTAGMMVGAEFGPELKTVLRRLLGLCHRLAVGVLLVVHLVKPPREAASAGVARTITDVMGNWTRPVASVMVLYPDKVRDDRVHLDVHKRMPRRRLVLSRVDGLGHVESDETGKSPLGVTLNVVDSEERFLTAVHNGLTPTPELVGIGKTRFYDIPKELEKKGLLEHRLDRRSPYELTNRALEAFSAAESADFPVPGGPE